MSKLRCMRMTLQNGLEIRRAHAMWYICYTYNIIYRDIVYFLFACFCLFFFSRQKPECLDTGNYGVSRNEKSETVAGKKNIYLYMKGRLSPRSTTTASRFVRPITCVWRAANTLMKLFEHIEFILYTI